MPGGKFEGLGCRRAAVSTPLCPRWSHPWRGGLLRQEASFPRKLALQESCPPGRRVSEGIVQGSPHPERTAWSRMFLPGRCRYGSCGARSRHKGYLSYRHTRNQCIIPEESNRSLAHRIFPPYARQAGGTATSFVSQGMDEAASTGLGRHILGRSGGIELLGVGRRGTSHAFEVGRSVAAPIDEAWWLSCSSAHLIQMKPWALAPFQKL